MCAWTVLLIGTVCASISLAMFKRETPLFMSTQHAHKRAQSPLFRTHPPGPHLECQHRVLRQNIAGPHVHGPQPCRHAGWKSRYFRWH